MEQNLDIGNLVKVFTEKVNQMSNDLIIKEAIILQLTKDNELLRQQNESLQENDKLKDFNPQESISSK